MTNSWLFGTFCKFPEGQSEIWDEKLRCSKWLKFNEFVGNEHFSADIWLAFLLFLATPLYSISAYCIILGQCMVDKKKIIKLWRRWGEKLKLSRTILWQWNVIEKRKELEMIGFLKKKIDRSIEKYMNKKILFPAIK